MYKVVVYISHTVWTLESSHDGMQGNIQFTDKCIMYWLNGQNIHYEIAFSQADTWLGVYPSWTQVILHQQYCIVEKTQSLLRLSPLTQTWQLFRSVSHNQNILPVHANGSRRKHS